MRKILIVALVIIVGLGGAFLFLRAQDRGRRTAVLKLDPRKEATHLSVVDDCEKAFWKGTGWFHWNTVEPERGQFDWDTADKIIRDYQDIGPNLLVNVFPFANWDQETCHPEEKYVSHFDPKKGGDLKVGKPCDMEAYKEFLRKVVERYDGDGIDDMPGLEIPVKYWEVMNEPESHGEGIPGETFFFYGTIKDYFDILRLSYETIKKADPSAKVLHAGMAGLDKDLQKFWSKVYSLGAADYFDIADIHSIDTDEKREDLFLFKFLKLAKKYGVADKPVWVTETQFGTLVDEPKDLKKFERTLARASVFALANGADKVFYISNWLYWEKGTDSVQDVYETLVDHINEFDTVEIIKQEYVEHPGDRDSITTTVGQYKFISSSRTVYVLWGEAALPAEITGEITITDIYGKSKVIQAKDLVLTSELVFVE